MLNGWLNFQKVSKSLSDLVALERLSRTGNSDEAQAQQRTRILHDEAPFDPISPIVEISPKD
jgi:hypothetical protein